MEIRKLHKKEYAGYRVWSSYQTDSVFAVHRENDSFIIQSKRLASPVTYDLPLTLFEGWHRHAQAFGVFDQDTLVGFIEGYFEAWNAAYRITNLFIESRYRRQGWATKLMEMAKGQALKKHAFQIILETQNTNTGAIAFYRHCGFQLIGLNLNEYRHEKAHQEQIRLEFALELKESL